MKKRFKATSGTWLLSLFFCLFFLADTQGVLIEILGFSFPFTHEGAAVPMWGNFLTQLVIIFFLNLALVFLRMKRITLSDVERLPKSWKKYWNKDGVRRNLFLQNFRTVIQPVAIWMNSIFILGNYLLFRYPALELSDLYLNRWTAIMTLITIIFLSQVLKQLRPPMRPRGIRMI